jgi:glycerol uptake facilitator-like aquaporin
LLLATVVGSGIMGERLAQGSVALALLANSLATGAVLFVLIQMLGPISGAHLNPVVTVVEGARGRLPGRDLVPYVVAQLAGAVGGVLLAHLMFGEAPFTVSTHPRGGLGPLLGEVVATFGLVSTVLFVSRHRTEAVAMAVSGWVVAGYWFTSSTSFANPAVTVARALTNSFAGIRPLDVAPFVVAQALGAALALSLFRYLTAPPIPASPGLQIEARGALLGRPEIAERVEPT